MEIKNFPLLGNNNELIEAINSVKLNQDRVIEITKKIQDSCTHVFEKNFIIDSRYIWNFYGSGNEEVLDSKICKKCGFELKRPKGSPWEICHKCWSPMADNGVIPGQGERTFTYKCTSKSCGHMVCHT